MTSGKKVGIVALVLAALGALLYFLLRKKKEEPTGSRKGPKSPSGGGAEDPGYTDLPPDAEEPGEGSDPTMADPVWPDPGREAPGEGGPRDEEGEPEDEEAGGAGADGAEGAGKTKHKPGVPPPSKTKHVPGTGSASVAPDGSDWVYSAGFGAAGKAGAKSVSNRIWVSESKRYKLTETYVGGKFKPPAVVKDLQKKQFGAPNKAR